MRRTSQCCCMLLCSICAFVMQLTMPFKGEVRAICRFRVFDGNGLLGHQQGGVEKVCTNSHKKRKGGGSANAPHCARSASDRAPFLQMLRMRLELLIGADGRQLVKACLFAPFAVVVSVLAPEERLFAPFGQLNLFL